LLHEPSTKRAAAGRLGPGPSPAGGSTTTTPATAGSGPVTTTPTTLPKPPGTAIGPGASVPVAGAASFTDPISGVPAYVVQPTAGVFRCFSGVCTHAGCTVDYSRPDNRFVCPCHGAEFDASTGAVLGGPTNQPLPAINVALGGDGQLYVTD